MNSLGDPSRRTFSTRTLTWAACESNDDRWTTLADDHWRFAAQLISMEDGQFNGFEGMMTEQFYFIDWSCLGSSVSRQEFA